MVKNWWYNLTDFIKKITNQIWPRSTRTNILTDRAQRMKKKNCQPNHRDSIHQRERKSVERKKVEKYLIDKSQ